MFKLFGVTFLVLAGITLFIAPTTPMTYSLGVLILAWQMIIMHTIENK